MALPLFSANSIAVFRTIANGWTASRQEWFVSPHSRNHQVVDSLQHDIGAMQYGLFTGYTAAVGWDPETAHLTDEGLTGTAT